MRWGTGAATTTKDILGKETERDDKEDDQREHDSDHHHSGHKGSTPRSSHPYPYRESHTAPGLHPADHEIERQEERKTSSSIGQHVESGPGRSRLLVRSGPEAAMPATGCVFVARCSCQCPSDT
jgi:hypothetical protein